MIALKAAHGITRWVDEPAPVLTPVLRTDILLRNEIGAVLRQYRLSQGATLRDIAAKSTVALGYISEVERGQKEASSEILGQLCAAVGASLPQLLLDTAARISALTTTGIAPAVVMAGSRVPDTIAGIHDTPAALPR